MRVGVNTLFFIPGDVGGSQTYLVETLRALAAGYPDTGLVLFTQLENDAYLRERLGRYPQVAFERLRFRASRRAVRILREQWELPRKIRRHALDGLWSPGYTAPLACRIPQAVSILDMQYRRFPQDLTPPARIVTHLLVRQAARRARRILTLSRFARDEIVRFTGTPAERIEVTPLAANPVFAIPVDAAVRAATRKRLLPDDAPLLLCVAHSYPHKNVAALIAAFGRLLCGCPHRLVLIGKPRRGEPAVSRALAALPDASRTTRLESVSLPDLAALYQSCDAFVFPSLYEGFGLPVLEAMAAGAPVVAADIPAAREIGGDWIRACDARDPAGLARAIRDALDEPAAGRARRIRGARARAAEFTWADTAKRTRASLAQAFGGVLQTRGRIDGRQLL